MNKICQKILLKSDMLSVLLTSFSKEKTGYCNCEKLRVGGQAAAKKGTPIIRTTPTVFKKGS